jgi:dipeptidyl aminopeptidase/acylaminoacyl peptidase
MTRLKSLALTSVLTFGGVVAPFSVAHAAPPAKAFGELPLAYDADLSPDGSKFAVIVNGKGTYYVATMPIDASAANMDAISLGPNLRPRYVKWINNERYVVATEKSQTYRSTPFTVSHLFTKSTEEEKPRIVLKSEIFRQFNDRVIDWLEDDEDHILMEYSKTEFDPYPSIYKVNVATRRDQRIMSRRDGIETWITDDKGIPRIGRGRSERGKWNMRILDPKTEQWDGHNSYPGLDADTPIFSILKDGTELIVGDYNNRDTLGLYIYDLNQKRVTRELFHNDQYDASGVVVSTDGETVIGAKYTADEEQTELLGEYGTLLTTLRAKIPGYSVNFVDQTDDGKTMIVRISSPFDPGGLYFYSRGDAGPSILQETYSGLPSSEMGDVVAVKYTARDGQKIPAYVTLPPTIKQTSQLKNLPFIVLPHGGPYGRDEKRFDYFAQFFATRGYGVMQMNFRGSEGYGKSFEDAGRDNWLVMQEDVEDATRYLLRKGYADPDRTCIAGWSYGGYAALMGAAKDDEGLYDCVIAMAALTDINDAKRDLKKYRGGKHAAKSFFGEAMKDKDVRKANSPVHVADNIKVPVFIAHGDQDENVQYDQFLRMRRALKKSGVKTTSMAFEDEDHFLSRQENREAFFIGVEKFLTEVNGPSEYIKE